MWVYLNWALGLKAVGCRVIWLELVDQRVPPLEVEAQKRALQDRLSQFDLEGSLALCASDGRPLPHEMTKDCLDLEAAAEADLLLDMYYVQHSELLARFRRSALVDIDPGLLQFWLAKRLMNLAPHDLHFTIGETVGTPTARFPDCDRQWHYTPPAVFLGEWPPVAGVPDAPYTTVSGWWENWMECDGEIYPNDKRTSFLEYRRLPNFTKVRLELALCLGPHDEAERRLLEQDGWGVRHAYEVSSTPNEYRAYIQQSRGEFSCAKPSCMRFENAWISDRSLCYLASGKPAVVQHTGPSRILPNAAGLFRFRTLDEAAHALDTAEADYGRHCRLARALVEEHFDAQKVVNRVLERAL
jgi:hypothetical protein